MVDYRDLFTPTLFQLSPSPSPRTSLKHRIPDHIDSERKFDDQG